MVFSKNVKVSQKRCLGSAIESFTGSSLSEQITTTSSILVLYDPNRETKVNADASSYGTGGVQDEGDWKPISYVLRALSPAEYRYSEAEKNA